QQLVSETNEVYRSEFLAAAIVRDALEGKDGLTLAGLRDSERAEGGLGELVRKQASARYDEGYERGIHDADATLILHALLELRESSGLLRFDSETRGLAIWFWLGLVRGGEGAHARRDLLRRRAASLGRVREQLNDSRGIASLAAELGGELRRSLSADRFPSLIQVSDAAGRYLAEELCQAELRFIVSQSAVDLRDGFLAELSARAARSQLEADLRELEANPDEQLAIACAWISAFTSTRTDKTAANWSGLVLEAAVLLLGERQLDYSLRSGAT